MNTTISIFLQTVLLSVVIVSCDRTKENEEAQQELERTSNPATLNSDPATLNSDPATLNSDPATLNSDPATLNSDDAEVKEGQEINANELLLTSDKNKAFYYEYPDILFGSEISTQEAISITTDFCSKLQVSPEQTGLYQQSYVTCEKYTSWIGYRKGLKCVCQFTNTLNNETFYQRNTSSYSSRVIFDWPKRYKSLTGGE